MVREMKAHEDSLIEIQVEAIELAPIIESAREILELKLVGKKIKFITSYMPKGDFDIMNLDKIETNGCEFDEPYFSTKDNSRFCNFEYAMGHKINNN